MAVPDHPVPGFTRAALLTATWAAAPSLLTFFCSRQSARRGDGAIDSFLRIARTLLPGERVAQEGEAAILPQRDGGGEKPAFLEEMRGSGSGCGDGVKAR